MMWMQGYGGGAGFVWGLMWISFVILVVALLVLAVRWFLRSERSQGGPGGGPPVGGTSQTPLDILRERYARGEIDDDEYERRRAKLGG